MVSSVNYCSSAQPLVYSRGKDHGLFCTSTTFCLCFLLTPPVQLKAGFDDVAVQKVFGRVQEMTQEVGGDSVAGIAFSHRIWKRWDPAPPKELRPFEDLKAGGKDDGDVYIHPKLSFLAPSSQKLCVRNFSCYIKKS